MILPEGTPAKKWWLWLFASLSLLLTALVIIALLAQTGTTEEQQVESKKFSVSDHPELWQEIMNATPPPPPPTDTPTPTDVPPLALCGTLPNISEYLPKYYRYTTPAGDMDPRPYTLHPIEIELLRWSANCRYLAFYVWPPPGNDSRIENHPSREKLDGLYVYDSLQKQAVMVYSVDESEPHRYPEFDEWEEYHTDRPILRYHLIESRTFAPQK